MPALRRFRLGLEDDQGFRPLIGVVPMGPGGNYPGGFFVYPSDSVPVDFWKYGPLDLPAGEGSVQAKARAAQTATLSGPGPKVHYHPHGFISASRTGDRPSVGIDATAIDLLGADTHRHCFTVLTHRPLLFGKDRKRPTDLRLRVHGPLETFEIVGYVGATSNLKPPFDRPPQNPFMADVVEDDGRALPTVVAVLTGNGVDRYLWLAAEANRPITWEDDDGGPTIGIYFFDHTAMTDFSKPAEIIGVWGLRNTAAGAKE